MTAARSAVYGHDTYGSGVYGPVAPGRHDVQSVDVRWDPDALTDEDAPTVLSIAIRRGRQSERFSVEQGRCTVVCHDPDGVYDPSNPASPLAGTPTLMRDLVVYASIDAGGVAERLFTGCVSRITHDPALGVGQTVIEAVDGFEMVSRVLPVWAATGPTTVGAVIGRVLDAASVPVALRALDDGSALPDSVADGTKTGLQIVQEVLLVDRGVYLVAADGVHTYRDRSAMHGRHPVAATLTSADAQQLLPGIDVLNVVNQQTVTRLPDGVAQTALDAASQADYRGARPGTPIRSAYLASDIQAASLASFVVTTRKQPDQATRALRLPGLTLAQLAQQQVREVGEILALVDLGAPEARIAGITHQVTDEQFVTDYQVTARSWVGFTVGRSTVGGPDRIAY